MFVGGIRALRLQSLHPLAMAGVDAHSGYRGDPWGRLQRTSYFLAVTTFGRAGDAKAATERVRAVHRRVTGTAPDGLPYAASDPHLLTWVHIAEADSFLRAHTRFGAEPLDQACGDGYVADVARIAVELGCRSRPAPRPSSRTGSASTGAERGGPRRPARRPGSCCSLPPLPLVARAPYGVLAAAATSLLPGWARRPLLPAVPAADRARRGPALATRSSAESAAISPPAAPPAPGGPGPAAGRLGPSVIGTVLGR